jgi:hypothetical protein
VTHTGRGTFGSGERNAKIWIDFRKSSRISLTSHLSQEREKSSRPVFTMCGEPLFRQVFGSNRFDRKCKLDPIYMYMSDH